MYVCMYVPSYVRTYVCIATRHVLPACNHFPFRLLTLCLVFRTIPVLYNYCCPPSKDGLFTKYTSTDLPKDPPPPPSTPTVNDHSSVDVSLSLISMVAASYVACPLTVCQLSPNYE